MRRKHLERKHLSEFLTWCQEQKLESTLLGRNYEIAKVRIGQSWEVLYVQPFQDRTDRAYHTVHGSKKLSDLFEKFYQDRKIMNALRKPVKPRRVVRRKVIT